MRFASLGSGSRGNALVVEAGDTRLLVDCGFGPREFARRLARIGFVPGDLDAILVTHEHSDHLGGVARCAARHSLDVFLTHGTLAAARLDGVAAEVFDSHSRFVVGDMEVQPFPVPHDAREPVQFVFSDGNRRLGILTDAGFVTAHMLEMLSGCDGLVLECNHDAALLAGGDYPGHLKRRIAGRLGHLDNDAAAGLLRQVGATSLQHVVAAHLSQQNNTPALARAALAEAMGCAPEWIAVADQDNGFGWLELA
ncbi:MAG: MBL fold metallo-hydrolase [Rhodocyclaceae bacterium]|nr:MBL fold metallo-hydrolase [Rhodocyclaceae bacterium]